MMRSPARPGGLRPHDGGVHTRKDHLAAPRTCVWTALWWRSAIGGALVLPLVLLVLPVTLLLSTTPLAAQETGRLIGRVLDEQTQAPISGVLVVVRGRALSTQTGADGRFEFPTIPADSQTVAFEHLSYGDSVLRVLIQADATTSLQVQLTSRAVELAPVVVETLTDLDRRRVSTGFAMSEIQRDAIDEASRRGLSLWELLRDALPVVRVRQESFGFISCVEFRGVSGIGGNCQMMAIFVDGVYMSSPGTIPPNFPLNDIERVEAISPGQAGVQYGTLGGNGVLLIETRQGPAAAATRRPANELPPGLDWSEEGRPYAWGRVATSSFVANSVGLGIGALAARRCLQVGDRGLLGIQERCGPLEAMAVSLIALGLPTLSGSYAARWAGTTDRSKGRLVPTIVMGLLPALSGYLLMAEAEATDSGVARGAGVALLTVGTPAFMTMSDRIFRTLR